jgi:hypothetical protein
MNQPMLIPSISNPLEICKRNINFVNIVLARFCGNAWRSWGANAA